MKTIDTRALRALALGCAGAAMLLTVTADNADARGGGRGGTMATPSVSSANRGANTANANRGNVNSGNVSTGSGNRGNINTGNVNNIQGGDRNTNINIDNDINIDGGYNGRYDYGYPGYHPVAAGAVIGAMAVTTAAVVGSYYYALPPSGCTVVVTNGISYQRCGSVYYQQTWQGDQVVYVVVNP
jgi:hypothetical protein